MSNRQPRPHDHNDPEPLAPEDITQDEDLLYSSTSAHYHCQSQAIRFRGDLDEDFRTTARNAFVANDLEAVPVQVTARNRQPDPVRINSEWDGVQLHLDILPTHDPALPVRSVPGALARHYLSRLAGVQMWKFLLVVLAILTFAVIVVEMVL